MLGRGGMAEAFLARRREDAEVPVVLKRIRPDFAHSEAYLRRFVLEAQVASRLVHPNLVRFREFGRVGECHYIVMDHVRGHSLHRLFEKSFPRSLRLSPNAALHLGTGLLEGLSAMHKVLDDDGKPRPMLHRDVTPGNIIVDLEGDPVLIDFGIAKDVNGPSITLPGQVIGTARYMAPEHRRAEYIDPRADVFSASVVLYELLVGQHPWPPLKGMRELLRTAFDPPEIPAEVRQELPDSVLSVVFRGLACAPEDRWADAEEMARALRRAIPKPDPELGRSAVRAWVDHLALPVDEALTRPVIDLQPPEGDDEEVMWSSCGRVARGPVTNESADAIAARSAVLTIPPLPPRRDEGVDLDEATAAAFGRTPHSVVPLALAGLAAGAACIAWLLSVP